MSGQIKINNHYFEHGNIQFSLDKSFQGIPLAVADGENIVAAIKKTETDYQSAIEEMHAQLGHEEGVFKKVRRILPVTGQKFNWLDPKLMK